MASAFIGFHVSLLLHSGIKLDGIVAHIDPFTQQMTLHDVTLHFPGQISHSTPLYGVVGQDIADLQIVSNKNNTSLQSHTNINQTITNTSPQILNQQVDHFKDTPSDTNNNYQRKQTEINGWANEDVKGFIEEEFDFQANLNMFDKAKVFAEIKESDETASETLLVSLNRLPRKILLKKEPKQVNLLPTENVLDYTPRNVRKTVKLVSVEDNVLCPAISPLQMAHAEHECISVIGLDEDQLIENGGRGVSELAMKILGGCNGKENGQRILVLAGNYKNGAYGLSVARRLLNHGYQVTVCMVTSDNPMFKATNYQRYLFEQIGGHIIYDLLQLFRPDLVIDSMLGSQTKLVDLQDERATYLSICDMIEWTNSNKLPVLSIDFPSGVDASTGQQHHPIHFIRPKWTICLAAPKTGCISRKITGELYVIDLGYPKLCWKKVGLKKHVIPWGTNFVINLNYLD
ncbi:YjeF N-terminal domain-containing protein [Cunninghamella echinulata]|nr:YjeF N-terminal domain-containing protein [Cunninghamella echinulata]